jgi:roadblock/LC7 domain-containing protein
MRFQLIFLSALVSLCSYAQVYTDVSVQYGVNKLNIVYPSNGMGISFYDVDKDGWDDITFPTTTDSLAVWLNLGGTGFQRRALFPITTAGTQPLWVDYDNDGDADFMWTKRSSGTKLYRNDGNWVFTDVSASLNLPATAGVHIYGQSWGDYDKDGWLDVYLCTFNTNNNIRNYLLHNNGNGTFTDVALAAGVDNGVRASLQSIWHDFNNDGWLDLFVENDLGQGNDLYVNDGDGTFTTYTSLSNLEGTNMFSMSASISDFDLDGDWDIYIANNAQGNELFVNDGNMFFTPSAVDLGIQVGSFCWGANWVDYDNDLDEDLHVTTATSLANQDVMFTNNGNGTFTNSLFPEFNNDFSFTYASAKGDFDHDGYYDLIVAAAGDSLCQLMQNQLQGNNAAKLSLQGTYSNREAIGTLVEYYVAGNKYMRYTYAGENYLSQNSQHMLLSMGSALSIDSLIITWPRGLVEKYFDVPSGQWIQALEGEQTVVNIQADNNGIVCEGDFITLQVGQWSSALWSTGSTESIIEVTQAGLYSVEVTNELGYTFYQEIEISNAVAPTYDVIVQSITCSYNADGEVEINSSNTLDAIVWNDGNQNFQRNNLAEGEYTFVLTNTNNCTTVGVVALEAPDAIDVQTLASNASCFGYNDGFATIGATGGSGNLNIDWQGQNPNALNAGVYDVLVTDENNCIAIATILVEQPSPIEASISVVPVSCFGLNDGIANLNASGGTGILSIDWQGQNNLALAPGDFVAIVIDENNCSVEVPYSITEPDSLALVLELTNVLCFGESTGTALLAVTGGTGNYTFDWGSENSLALAAGTYNVLVWDENNCQTNATFDITEPTELTSNGVVFNASALNDGEVIITPIGGTAPYTYLWSNNDNDSIAENLLPGDYTCTITDANGCIYVFAATVLFDSVTELVGTNKFSLYPNPAHDIIHITQTYVQSFNAEIYDLAGRVVIEKFTTTTLDVSDLSPGSYIIKLITKNSMETQSFIVN